MIPMLGLFQFTVMSFGLHSFEAMFQCLLDKIIGPDLEPKTFAYLDDLVLVSESFEEHLRVIEDSVRPIERSSSKIKSREVPVCHVIGSVGRLITPSITLQTGVHCTWPIPWRQMIQVIFIFVDKNHSYS